MLDFDLTLINAIRREIIDIDSSEDDDDDDEIRTRIKVRIIDRDLKKNRKI